MQVAQVAGWIVLVTHLQEAASLMYVKMIKDNMMQQKGFFGSLVQLWL